MRNASAATRVRFGGNAFSANRHDDDRIEAFYPLVHTYTHEQTRANSCALESALTLTLVDNKHLAGWVRTPRESSVEICLRDFAASSDRVPIYGLFSAESSSLCGRLCEDGAGFVCVRELERGVFFLPWRCCW